MNQKEKEKNKNTSSGKIFTGKRLLLSVVFLCVAFTFFNAQIQVENNKVYFYSHAKAQYGQLVKYSANYAASILLPGYKEAKLLNSIDGGKSAKKIVEQTASVGKSVLVYAFNCLLYACLQVISILLLIAGIIFDWVVKAETFKAIMEMGAIVKGWIMVRDVLNLASILVLLFSAFCTIFQVDKYNWKKILLTLVIMALLVNFSFPIARFIIDSGNIPMYYFIQMLARELNSNGPNQSISVAMTNIVMNGAGYGADKGRANLFLPEEPITDSTTLTIKLIAAIIFVFSFSISLLVIAVLLLIRMIVLAILVIFSPVGFVAAIFPGFSKYADEWWTSLFKQSFFGTVMTFMLLISVRLMKEMNSGINSSLKSSLGNIGQEANSTIVAGVLMVIPIVLLWIGIISAQKMGAMGAGSVVGRATRVAAWAGRTFSGAAFAGRAMRAYNARRQEAQNSGVANRMGKWLGSRQDQLRSHLPGGRDAGIRYERDLAARVKQESERNDTGNMAERDLRNLANNGNRFERAAAIQELANRSKSTQGDFDDIRNVFGETSQVFRQLQNKVKEFDPAIAFSHIANDATRIDSMHEYITSNKFDQGKLSAGALGNAELMEIMIGAGAIGNDDLEKHRKKSQNHAMNIQNSLGAIVARATDHTNRTHQKIQMAFTAQTGHLSGHAISSSDWQKYIAQNANKDTFKRFEIGDINQIRDAITEHSNSGQLKDIVKDMENNDAKRNLVRHIHGAPSMGPNHETLRGVISRDSYLGGFI